ncbi:MAG: CoA transferase [Antarcticimicrobium sp.]|uniref:CaiB/BaiF CoA transferase family protein n=1 Tax=Antarcticimicrobium sp. TaxID=2824147 RepID=UPI00262E73D2|nr:CoA transferase [Antarcticimicrobium sp.]MDF1717786.1 CoA transferase [Antarcticimicrobium sp.]
MTDTAAPAAPASQSGPAPAWQPLAGVRVVDFSALLPGPLAGAILADLGAEVIKVEPLAGEGVRHREVLAPILHAANRSKTSLAIDLKRDGAAKVVEQLARWGDIALESFRPGVAARLGIDHASLSAVNPQIISCSVSGYGQNGPWRDAPGHDLNFLAAGGAFAFSGHWTGRPRRSGLPVADLLGAGNATIAILAALNECRSTGRGMMLDVALMDAVLFGVSMRHGLDGDGGTGDSPYPTNDLFATADGREIALGVGTEEHLWQRFRTVMEADMPMILEGRFDTDAGRRAHGDALFAALSETFLRRDAADWMARFEAAGVPANLCLFPAEAVVSDHVRARGFVRDVAGHHLSAFPASADGRQPQIRAPAPEAGAGTREILATLGFAPAAVEALLRDAVVADSQTGGAKP